MIDESNLIHETACIHPSAKIGKDNFIGPFCYIGKGVTIGDQNEFVSHCSVGCREEKQDFGSVTIGSRNFFSAFCLVFNGKDFSATVVKDDCQIHERQTIYPNSIIEDNTIL